MGHAPVVAVRTKDMSISVNGQSLVPPGFRFHPTEEELLNYYLRKKVASEKIDLDVIRDVDLNKLEPWDIQEMCRIGSTQQTDWYFFSHKDKKYPTGTRTNRATAAGFWKATGRDKVIYASFNRIGMRKTLVFYGGRAPHGQKSDWIMYEYRLDEYQDAGPKALSSGTLGEAAPQEEGWVVCRVFKKNNHRKGSDSPKNSSSLDFDAKMQMLQSGNDGGLDQILRYMGRSHTQETGPRGRTVDALIPALCTTTANSSISSHLRYLRPKETTLVTGLEESLLKLPALDGPGLQSLPGDRMAPPIGNICSTQSSHPSDISLHAVVSMDPTCTVEPVVSDWAALDRLVAYHFNGQADASRRLATCFGELSEFGFGAPTSRLPNTETCGGSCTPDCPQGDIDLWAFVQSASSPSPDRFCHVPRASA